jgi:hypothetical protein
MKFLEWRTLYYLNQQSRQGKKGTIVAMIAGTKADTAIIEKSSQRAIKSQRLP